MKHLKNMAFPADKGKILQYAQKGPGPDTKNVMEILARIPERTYRSPLEIIQEVSKLKKSSGTAK